MKRSSVQSGAITVLRGSTLHLFALLALVLARTSTAFQVTNTYHISPSTALRAWSLPHEASFTFRTWYNEYNPTARVTVYNDPDPFERYSFVTVGSDWPSMLESSTLSPQPSSRSPKRYANPIKRAWRRRTLRRMFAAARRSYGIVQK